MAKSPLLFGYEAFTLCGLTFQKCSPKQWVCNSSMYLQLHPACPSTPYMQRLQAYTYMVWAPPRSLAATWGISLDFFSSGY